MISSKKRQYRCGFMATGSNLQNYSLQVDQLLRKHLQDEAKRRLNDWAERNKDSRNGKDVKKLLEKM
ncbi:hypothetical protein EIMP300_41780 [Escherichia coli]|uniref:Uncharacterized protein n=1 Tax=Escherichia coli TaxID=562 RepID=A0A8S0FRQ1_ECOLX|nr:hypothetical protein EIMP300_41780 [Escherichia coli]